MMDREENERFEQLEEESQEILQTLEETQETLKDVRGDLDSALEQIEHMMVQIRGLARTFHVSDKGHYLKVLLRISRKRDKILDAIGHG